MIEISFKNIKKIYPGEKIALDDLNLEIKKGEFLTVIGPSGCGKTTLLKMINGLVMPTQGELLIDGKNIKDIDIIALRRKIGYVIQQIGLFPHLNIEKNISYVLKIMGVEPDKRRKRAEELIDLVGLEKETLEMYPRELSGGQQQRIGVIRALAADPPIILMDEPFGAIDEITRKTLQDELLKLQERLKKTIVFITHDIEEAMKLGDRIALINKGKLEQIASSKEMFFNPRTPFVKEFFGRKSFSSFMNTTKVLEGIDKDYPYILFDRNNDIIKLNGSKQKMEKIPAIDSEGEYLGMITSTKENITFKDIEKSQSISSNFPMMKAVEFLFKEGLKVVPIVDDNNNYLGMFSLDRGYREILKGLENK